MSDRTSGPIARLTKLSVGKPWVTVAIALVLVAIFLGLASQLVKEVGYSAYFGRDNPEVHRIVDFQKEFQVGLPILVVFGCRDTSRCDSVGEPWALDFIGRLHSRIDALPNVLSTTSVLNTPIVVGPLETQTLGRRSDSGAWELADGWEELLERGREQGLMTGVVLSEDARTAGIVVELQSIDSVPMQQSVHDLFDLLPEFEKELGTSIYMAGEPIWNVSASDMIDHDSIVGTVGIFTTMFVILWLLYRDPAMTLLPLAAIGPLFAAIQGFTVLLGIPVTLILGVVQPLVLVIALTISVHYLTAFLRCEEGDITKALIDAARDSGPGCFWAATTTALGFCTFFLSDLRAFRDVGQLSALGCVLGFVMTFTLLPALIEIRGRWSDWRPGRKRASALSDLLSSAYATIANHSRLVLAASLAGFVVLSLGLTQLFYAADVGFGDRSFVIRSSRFIDENLRKPETLDVTVQIPEGKRIYDREPLMLLADLEKELERDPYTGRAWSFVDLLQSAYRLDRGEPAETRDELMATARRTMSVVATLPQTPSFWSETVQPGSNGDITLDRARIMADRGWLGSETEAYTDRVRATLKEFESRYPGYQIELQGGLPLIDLFVSGVRSTQQETFSLAFGIVALTLIVLFFRSGFSLVFWAVLANLLPVLSVLGLMGWAGIGIDLSNVMLSAVLLVLVVDDTIHMSLRYQRERRAGHSVQEALALAYPSIGEAVLTSSLCLALGFCAMLLAQWTGLVFFGLFLSVGVVFALAGDLLLLPAALLVTARSEAE